MASQGGMNNLTTLIKRLEAATSRLEDIASTTSPPPSRQDHDQNQQAPIQSTNLNGETGQHAQGQASGQTVGQPPVPPSVAELDSILHDDLKPFYTLSQKLGGLVAEQAAAFDKAFSAQRQVVLIASKAKEPGEHDSEFLDVLSEIQIGIEHVTGIRERNRKSPQDNHLSMLSDGVGVLAWLTVRPKGGENGPDEYVGDVLGGAKMYGNRILTAYKDKERIHVDWVTAFVRLCGSLKSYIKQFHPRGLKWNPNGVSPQQALEEAKRESTTVDGSIAPPAAPVGGGAPPPPPPPMPSQLDLQPPSTQNPSSGGPDSMGAVFQDLNRGEAVTSGLRKVDKSQMTHKNPSLRTQEPDAPARSDSSGSNRGKSPAPNRKPDSMRAKKPPRKQLDGNKWTVEHYENGTSPVEIDAEKQQSILVSRCKSTTIKVNGKANAISIDNCSRLDLIVDSLVSSVEVINVGNFRMQVVGTLPTVQLDKVDVATLFLSKESLHTEVLTSKCSSVNVTLPPASEQDDSVECPVPEQIKSYIKNGQLVSEIVKSEGM